MRLTSRLTKLERRQARVHLARTSTQDNVIVISWNDDWRDDWNGSAPVAVVNGELLDALLKVDEAAPAAPAPAPETTPEPEPTPAAPLHGFRESALPRPAPRHKRARIR